MTMSTPHSPERSMQLLNLKQVKVPIKQAGLRLSSHAFDLLNGFIELLLKQMPVNVVWPCCHERLQECIVDLDLLPEARHAYLGVNSLLQQGMTEEAAQGFVRCVNRIVDLILAVTISLVESRGQSTVRQADLMQVLRRVPVLEPIRGEINKLVVTDAEEADKENVADNTAIASKPTTPLIHTSYLPTPRPILPAPPAATAPPVLVPSANVNSVVKTIVCLDNWLPWCKTEAQAAQLALRTHLVSSVGVETDDYDISLDQRAILSAHLQGLIDRIVQLK